MTVRMELDPKSRIIWDFCAAKTKMVADLHELNLTQKEILEIVANSTFKPSQVKDMLRMFNIGKRAIAKARRTNEKV